MIDYKSLAGYKDSSPYKNNKSILINSPNKLITMDGVSIPIFAQDETGYGKLLMPNSGTHQFKGTKIMEKRLFQSGGQFLLDGTWQPGYLDKKTGAWVETGDPVPPKNKQVVQPTTPVNIWENPQPLVGGVRPAPTNPYIANANVNPQFSGYQQGMGNLNTAQLSQASTNDILKWHQEQEFDDGLSDTNPTKDPNSQARNNEPVNPFKKKRKSFNMRLPGPEVLPAISAGLTMFSTKVEEGRQKAWQQKQMAQINQTYSNAQNDYGVDPYEQTGQFRPYLKSGGIHINPANKGKFNATKARTGKTTEELTHSSNPITRKRAIFAQNAAKWHHQEGGIFKSGGKFDIYKYLYEEDDNKQYPETKEAPIQKKKAPRITEDDVDELTSLGLDPMSLLIGENSYKNYKSSASVTNGSVSPQDAQIIKQASEKHNIPANILAGIYGAETSYGKNVKKSSAGAQGAFQFMPKTAKQYGVDVNDFSSSANGAAKYLSVLYKKFGSWEKAIAAYNAGEGNIAKGRYPVETQAYVPKVLANAANNKFQQGGRQPIVVTNSNDPRLKAYNDSLNLYKKNYNDAKNSDPLMNVNEVIPLVGDEGIRNADKRTGIQPIGMYKSRDLDTYNAYWSAFKKPVQPVVYQKPQQKDFGYTLDNAPKELLSAVNEFGSGKRKRPVEVLTGIFDKYGVPKKMTPQGLEYRVQDLMEQPEKIFPVPIAGQSKPAQITIPQQSIMPEQSQDGQIVYGPSNGAIGYMNNGVFIPINSTMHLSPKMNKADLELLNNKEALNKYVSTTPRYKMGGITKTSKKFLKGGVFDMDEKQIQDLIKQGYKIERL